MTRRATEKTATKTSAHTSALDQLRAVRHRYGDGEREAKLQLLDAIAGRPPRSARGVAAYHDDLLFLSAFPDDARVFERATQGLSSIARIVRKLSPPQRRLLADSGIVGTVTRHTFAYGIAQWLVSEGEDADVEWSRVESPERLDPLLRLTLTQAESDAFDSGELSTTEWMRLARGSGTSALCWLADVAPPNAANNQTIGDPATVRLLYEALELPVRWHPSARRATTGNVVDGGVIYPRSSMRALPRDPVTHIATPLPQIARLEAHEALRWIAASRAALAARCREVHAITYANPHEVYVADLGEGTALCLIGAALDDRLTLETNYGYVMYANGVPIGYGGVTPLSDQANTGVNVFEAFRKAEAPMLFAQTLRAFRTLFGISRFVVNPFQFGAGNDEALASGAFWLYDRLGFRSVDPGVAAVATRERERIAANPKHRTSLTTLRKIATSDVVLELPGSEERPLFHERWLVSIARAVTEASASPGMWTKLARVKHAIDSVVRTLGISAAAQHEGTLTFGLKRLAPVIALILRDVEQWSRGERDDLVAVIAAKGSPQERDFALVSRTHDALWGALRRFCEDVDSRARGARRSVNR